MAALALAAAPPAFGQPTFDLLGVDDDRAGRDVTSRLSQNTRAAPALGLISEPARSTHKDPHRFSLLQPEAEDQEASVDELSQVNAGGGSSAADLAKQLSNPIADLTSVPFQFNYDTGYGDDDGARVTLNIQPVVPISLDEDWMLISRTIAPVIYQEELFEGDDDDFGLGDTVQSLFFSPRDPVDGWILGAGPVLLLPTGTDPQLRSEQLGLGPTAVALRQDGPWTYGALVNHIWGVTDSNSPDVNATFLQPFVSYTWPTATTLALNMEMTYDWEAEETTLPLNLMLTQVTTMGGQPVSVQGGFRYYADSPPGGAEWGLRFAVTFLFPK